MEMYVSELGPCQRETVYTMELGLKMSCCMVKASRVMEVEHNKEDDHDMIERRWKMVI